MKWLKMCFEQVSGVTQSAQFFFTDWVTNELKNSDRKSQNDSKIYYSGDDILGEANQSKNLKMDGANDTNDTPVFVEVEAKSNRRVVENEAILGKENQYKTLEVVIIPNGSFSPNISSNNISRRSSPKHMPRYL